ncbi:hypothetical protein AALP_AA7G113000 [Arabis alpina]|uniref:RNB domain-containing protein n=1 Tax=Arabis alpina TaxID=50452 RepID=A0A087GHC9_ARAAL|nr:hypothetical protein AALP_AA7G113000 [Arabis alpina]
METETEVVLIENDVDYSPFSSQVLSCLPPLPWSVSSEDVSTPVRKQLRHLLVFSVDPPGCKDIDDALHCTSLPNGNFEVGVHIADVTNFVHPGTPLDDEASKRGTSVYLVDRRFDMLPKPLTGIIFLQAEVERLAFSVIWEMSPEAEIISTRFTKSIIKSSAALSYVEAHARMDDSRLTNTVTTDLRNMNTLAKIMRQKRIDRGALTLASAEVKFQIDAATHDPLDIGMCAAKFASFLISMYQPNTRDSNRPESRGFGESRMLILLGQNMISFRRKFFLKQWGGLACRDHSKQKAFQELQQEERRSRSAAANIQTLGTQTLVLLSRY